jgi:phosphopentomutase
MGQADPASPFERVLLVVIDSLGVGELPDAATYGDEGSDTVGNIDRACGLRAPNLRALGLERVSTLLASGLTEVHGAFGRMAEASPGKDSVTGHWEMAGIVLDRPFPVFPRGFPAEVIAALERRIGRATLGNVVASGTEIIERLGPTHVASGAPIVYTSADSVCQIAAHEAVVPIAELYEICEAAFEIFCTGLGVGRVIARPFDGVAGHFRRTARRHDYALTPRGTTLLDVLASAQVPVTSIGKIRDLFAGRSTGRALPTASDAEGMACIDRWLEEGGQGLAFANLVDSDTTFGHRNDTPGYAANLEAIDSWIGRIHPRLEAGDLMLVTGDHGNDPTTPSTDHSREYVPVLAAGPRVRAGVDLGVLPTFADLGQTIAHNFSAGPLAYGTSFLERIRVDHP